MFTKAARRGAFQLFMVEGGAGRKAWHLLPRELKAGQTGALQLILQVDSISMQMQLHIIVTGFWKFNFGDFGYDAFLIGLKGGDRKRQTVMHGDEARFQAAQGRRRRRETAAAKHL